MTAYLPDTLSMAPMFVYDILGRRVAYSCRDIRAEMRRGKSRYRHGDAFVISQPKYLRDLELDDRHRAVSETIETITLRVREFRHGRGRDHAFELCGEFRDKADEQRYLGWYPELRPDWDDQSIPPEAPGDGST